MEFILNNYSGGSRAPWHRSRFEVSTRKIEMACHVVPQYIGPCRDQTRDNTRIHTSITEELAAFIDTEYEIYNPLEKALAKLTLKASFRIFSL
jgi:hypothetical protein